MSKSNMNKRRRSRKCSMTKTINNLDINPNLLKLPLIILNFFQNTSQSIAHCKLCYSSIECNTSKIVEHVITCTTKGYFTSNTYKKFVEIFDCKVCNFVTTYFSDYKLHVISTIHLKNFLTIDSLYSYFCIVCSSYIYGSKSLIMKHCKKKHNTSINDLPFITKVLADNYKYISNNPDSTFIDYCNNEMPNEKNLESHAMKCYACKINFYTSVDDYNLHKISSEHIILKYFSQKIQSLNTINFNGSLPKSILNINLDKQKSKISKNMNNNKNLHAVKENKGKYKLGM